MEVWGYSLLSVLLFCTAIVGMLVIDLYAHRGDKAVTFKNAALWSVVWVSISLLFAWHILLTRGGEDASLFMAGYLLEQSLAVDNLFVFMAVFASFGIIGGLQHRILYYGILGAIVLRLLFIGAGTSLLVAGDFFAAGEWVLVGFGAIVLWSAWKMLQGMREKDDTDEIEDYSNHWSIRGVKRFIPVWPRLVGHNFFTWQNGMLYATPLLLCLVCIEFSDVMFAFDSVPAVIAVTQDPFLIYTSNIFAVLGLRSMYFLLAAAKRFLCHLEKAVIAILAFIGFKMLIPLFDLVSVPITGQPFLDLFGIEHISAMASLAVVGTLLATGILASVVFPEREGDEAKA
ncbi:MAG: TerC/Alx family metal homeostasis membrane protein [Parcubacteria group bacterium]|nr:TerC/Alx family metal homeostasis membrane protein [Parcubacteria group bacterium]